MKEEGIRFLVVGTSQGLWIPPFDVVFGVQHLGLKDTSALLCDGGIFYVPAGSPINNWYLVDKAIKKLQEQTQSAVCQTVKCGPLLPIDIGSDERIIVLCSTQEGFKAQVLSLSEQP